MRIHTHSHTYKTQYVAYNKYLINVYYCLDKGNKIIKIEDQNNKISM